MRVRNFNNSSLTVFVGRAPGISAQFNQGTTANGTSVPFSYRWTAANSTLAVWRGTTQICSYVYDIRSGLQSPKGNVLTTSFWVASNANSTVTLFVSNASLNGMAVDASAFTCTSTGGRVNRNFYIQNWANGIDLNSDFTFNFTLNIPSTRANYAGGESTKMEVGLGYINNPKAVLTGTNSICNGSNAQLSVAFTGNAPYSVTYSNGSTSTSVSGITSNPYTIAVSPVVNTSYSLTSVTDAFGTAALADMSGTATITVNNAPVVNGFSPAKAGPGATITITGSGFSNINSITMGGAASNGFTVVDNSTITATVAFGNSGTILVAGSCGTGNKAGFEYSNITQWLGNNSNWNEAANWDNGIPNQYYHAVVTQKSHLPIVSNNATWMDLTINENAQLSLANQVSLTISGSLVNNGAVKGNGTLQLNGTALQTISGRGSISNLQFNNSNGIYIEGNNSQLAITEKLIPVAGVLNTNDKLVLRSTEEATAIITAASYVPYINGKVIVERYVAAKRSWRLMSFPVTSTDAPTINQSLQEGAGGNSALNPFPGFGTHITGGVISNGFDQNPAGNASVRTWNGTVWQALTSTNLPITNHDAYMVFVRGSRANNLSQGTGAAADATVLRVAGYIKQGTQDVTLAQTGWQLVANPFAAVIDLQQLAAGNSSLVNANFKVWDNKLGGSNNVGGYVTVSYDGEGNIDVVPTPASSINNLLQPGAVFFADVTQTGLLKIEESYKQSSRPTQLFRGAPVAKLKINLLTAANNTVVDGAMVAYSDSYNSAIDAYDASKLNSQQSENIFITTQNQRYSINRRNSAFVTDTIVISFGNVFLKNYVLEMDASQFNSSYSSAEVLDVFTGATTAVSLTGTTRLAFTVSQNAASYAANRFVLVLKKAVVLPVKISSSSTIVQQGKLNINFTVQQQQNISRYAIQQSTNGTDFVTVGWVTATNSLTAYYRWNAQDLLTSVLFCRVVAIDADGTHTYSQVMKVQPEKLTASVNGSIQGQQLRVQLMGMATGTYELSLFNQQGQQVAMFNATQTGNAQQHKFALPSNLPTGIYHFRIAGRQGIIQVIQMANL
jgi:hypothetical protein